MWPVVLLATAGFAALGFYAIRRDVENLRVISQDNTQWSASQIEMELVRFRLAVSSLIEERTSAALEEMHERFDIPWSRVFLLGQRGGREPQALRRRAPARSPPRSLPGGRSIPSVAAIDPADAETVGRIERRLQEFQHELREYTLRIVRADGAASACVRERIHVNARSTALISIAAVMVSLLSLVLILRENRRQQHLAEANRRAADQAEQASRAKSRFSCR